MVKITENKDPLKHGHALFMLSSLNLTLYLQSGQITKALQNAKVVKELAAKTGDELLAEQARFLFQLLASEIPKPKPGTMPFA